MKNFSFSYNSFQPLLEDHYFGRLFCWRIHEGVKHGVDPQRIALYAQSFWQQSLSNHLKDEEVLLLTDQSNPLIQKAIADHLALYNLFTQITNSGNHSNTQQLSYLASTLDEHIHYEEKTLFPHLRNTLNHNLLKTIYALLKEDNRSATKQKYLYADEFWKGAQSSL